MFADPGFDPGEVTSHLCGEIWDGYLMRHKYGLSHEQLPLGSRMNCAEAHRGFGKWFALRYQEAHDAWIRAELVVILREYWKDLWPEINRYLKW